MFILLFYNERRLQSVGMALAILSNESLGGGGQGVRTNGVAGTTATSGAKRRLDESPRRQ